jgi:DNA modification methylase
MSDTYQRREWSGDSWRLINGDSCEELPALADDSVDLSVYSPPFSSLYTYSASDRDIGNCATHKEFLAHLAFVIQGLLRVTKPGRLTCCHIAQLTSTKATHGVIGLIDLRGAMVKAFTDEGWIYHGDVCIDKDPQAQAIRTHSKALLFVQLRKDSSWLRPALADYILVFRKPGENLEAIHPDLSNDEWIEWARPIWYGIQETNTLNTAVAKENDDERHICPLQLGTIERCIRLWSNPGDLVLSPFAGIGSEGFEAVRLNRRFIGIELKASYATTAAKNLALAATLQKQGTLFHENATVAS